jgi:hypothetical protein
MFVHVPVLTLLPVLYLPVTKTDRAQSRSVQIRRIATKNSNNGDRGLLRPRYHRPHGHTANPCDEFAPPHPSLPRTR